MEVYSGTISIANTAHTASSGKSDGAVATPTMVETKYGQQQFADWGSDNDQPRYILDKISKSIASSGNLLNVHKIIGIGLQVVRSKGFNDKNEEILEPINDKKINEFFRINNINRFLLDTCRDLVTLGNAFPEFILSRDRKKINRISRNKAAQCRLTVLEKGISKHIGVSAMWPRPKDEEIQLIENLNPRDALIDIESRSKGFKFGMQLTYSTDDKDYYHDPFWYSAILSGWVDVGNEVPAMKNAIFKNQMNIKFHITIPVSHFKHKYKDWERKTEEQRKTLISDELTMIKSVLSGSEQSGKAFYDLVDVNPLTREVDPGWTIKIIEDQWKEGAHLPDSAAANSEILFRQIIDPSTLGAGMVGGPYSGSAGSGSDKREADLLKTSLLKPFRDELVRPIELIRDFNKWPEDSQFRFMDKVLTTLDEGKGSKKIVS